jgi:spermidine synthase
MVASRGPDPASLATDEVDARIADRAGADLRYYDGQTHTGMFALPNYLRGAKVVRDRVIPRDKPLYVP